MDVSQLVPELRVALIAVKTIPTRSILIIPTKRWTEDSVPGAAVRHSDKELQTLDKLVRQTGLEPISEPRFLGRESAINPKQFYLPGAHMMFLEYEIEVEGKSKIGEFYTLHEILYNCDLYYAFPQKKGFKRNRIVEKITYKTLKKYEKNNHPK